MDFRVSTVWSNSVNFPFWREPLNDQMSSQFAETYFVVCFTKCTSTHIKESSWVTIWIWKIKMSQHVNSLLLIRDLERFLSPKEHCIQTWGHCLSHLEVESGLGSKIKFVILHSNFHFYLRSNSMQAFQAVGQHRSKPYHEKDNFSHSNT